MFLGSFPLIWWNEHRALQWTVTLQDGMKQLQYVPDHDKLSNDLLGKLVHVTGPLTTETLRDAEFGVEVPALRLTRQVEAYQWREHRSTRTSKDRNGNEVTTTDVSYSPEWSGERIDSNSFEDTRYKGRNPARWPVSRSTLVSSSAAIGAYRLPRSVVESLGTEGQVDLTDPRVSAVGRLLAAAPSSARHRDALQLSSLKPASDDDAEARGNSKAVAAAGTAFRGLSTLARGMTLSSSDGRLYHGSGSVTNPETGDVRVGFTAAAPSAASIIARLERGGRLEPFVVPSTGKALLLSGEGDVTPQQLFDRAHSENAVMTWVLRGGGWLLAVIGIALVLQPAAVAPTWIPIIGTLAGDVVSCGIMIVALVTGSTTAAATIAIAWFAVRPLLSAAVLAGCAAVVYLLRVYGGKGKAPPKQD